LLPSLRKNQNRPHIKTYTNFQQILEQLPYKPEVGDNESASAAANEWLAKNIADSDDHFKIAGIVNGFQPGNKGNSTTTNLFLSSKPGKRDWGSFFIYIFGVYPLC